MTICFQLWSHTIWSHYMTLTTFNFLSQEIWSHDEYEQDPDTCAPVRRASAEEEAAHDDGGGGLIEREVRLEKRVQKNSSQEREVSGQG